MYSMMLGSMVWCLILESNWGIQSMDKLGPASVEEIAKKMLMKGIYWNGYHLIPEEVM